MSDRPEFDKALGLVGQEVEVILEHGKPDGTDAVVARGTLLSIDDGGQVVLRDEMGFAHYCWPMLAIKESE